MTDKKQNAGMLLVFLGSVCWSLNAPLVRFLDMDPFLTCGMRALIAGLALLPFLRPKKIRWGYDAFMMCLSFALLSLCVIIAIMKTSAAIAVGMQYAAPVWLFIYSRFKHEPYEKRSLIPLGVLTAGVVVSMCSHSDKVTLVGNLLALSTGIWFAMMGHYSAKLSCDNPTGMSSICNLFTAAIVLPLFARGSFGTLATLSTTSWIVLVLLGVMQIGLGYALYYRGLRTVSVQKAAMIAPCEMVLGPVWVAIFFHELPDVIGMIGFLLVVAGVLLEVLMSSAQNRKAGQAAANSGV